MPYAGSGFAAWEDAVAVDLLRGPRQPHDLLTAMLTSATDQVPGTTVNVYPNEFYAVVLFCFFKLG